MRGRVWQIRAASPKDAAALARLRYAFRTERRAATEPQAEFLQRCERWMAERLEAGGSWRCWTAVAEEQLVASLWLQLIEKLPNPADETELHGYVTSIYVAPPHRKAGIACGLLAACLRQCEESGVDAVFLWSTPDSRRLYQRFGFTVRDDLLERR